LNERAYYYGTGRRKTAVARIRLFPGEGPLVINGKPFDEAFSEERLRKIILEPLMVTNTLDKFNATIKVSGGGISGQAGAIRHSIARALVEVDESLRPLLRSYGVLTRDSRVKERKKYGLVRARKAKQYTKR
jgi:small subunit ribosomal protein S9